MKQGLDIKKVGRFIKSLSDTEYIYLGASMSMRDHIQKLLKLSNASKEEFCKKFEINPAKYNDFIKGNYNYDCKDMAVVNAWFMEIEMERLKENAPIQVRATEK